MLTESKRILLAEDNDINALLARTILEKAGHAVTRAHNGAEAVSLWLERLDNEAFEVILMDLQMPVMDGLDALREIRAREKNIGEEKVPVYILTADEQQDTRIATDRAGADGFLTKPLEPSRLLDVVVQGKVDM
jgi:CheY-like chemotaxis protein